MTKLKHRNKQKLKARNLNSAAISVNVTKNEFKKDLNINLEEILPVNPTDVILFSIGLVVVFMVLGVISGLIFRFVYEQHRRRKLRAKARRQRKINHLRKKEQRMIQNNQRNLLLPATEWPTHVGMSVGLPENNKHLNTKGYRFNKIMAIEEDEIIRRTDNDMERLIRFNDIHQDQMMNGTCISVRGCSYLHPNNQTTSDLITTANNNGTTPAVSAPAEPTSANVPTMSTPFAPGFVEHQNWNESGNTAGIMTQDGNYIGRPSLTTTENGEDEGSGSSTDNEDIVEEIDAQFMDDDNDDKEDADLGDLGLDDEDTSSSSHASSHEYEEYET